MPKTPVDECPAGTAIDIAVAKARGWTIDRSLGTPLWKDDCGKLLEDGWSPSTDIAAAQRLLSGDVTIHKTTIDGWGDQYHCIIGPEYGYCMELLLSAGQAKADTLPLAICRAFLKASDIEYIEVPDEDTG